MSPAGGNRGRTTCREVWFNVCVRVVIKVRLIRIAKSMLMLEFFDVSLREKIIFHKDIFLHIQALTEPDLIYVFFFVFTYFKRKEEKNKNRRTIKNV